MKIRVVLVSDNAPLRAGMRALVEAGEGMAVVGESRPRVAALGGIACRHAHVAVLGLEDDGLDFLALLCDALVPTTRVLVVSGSSDADVHLRVLRAGAMGIVPKARLVESLVPALRELCAGRAWVDGALMAQVICRFANPAARCHGIDDRSLTAREREIAALVSRGLHNREVAARLFLSEGTVRNHLTVIFRKLGLAHRCDLIVRWIDHTADARATEAP